jgi:dimethylamine/trimethylamine dehydrogenase
MVDLVRKKVLDFIGAARPSIADPFLPKKIEEGRLEDIRECIGCNICVATQYQGVPQHCTQNPTMGNEWRRGWHPERIPPKDTDDTVLVVGAGPAGLEAATALGRRGYQVILAEATRELGGRVSRECKLPGLATWGRVRDWRVTQLSKLPNVTIYRESRLNVQSVIETGCSLVAVATGASWRKDGQGRRHSTPLAGLDSMQVYTPDDIMDGVVPQGPVVLYDDDRFYMAGAIAEKLLMAGVEVAFVTPDAIVSSFSHFTLDQERIQKRLLELGVRITSLKDLVALHKNEVEISCVFTGRRERLEAASVVLVTMQTPNDALYHELMALQNDLQRAGIRKVVRIGDAYAPGIIAAAVYSGHLYARRLDVMPSDEVDYRIEDVELGEF